MSSLKIDQIVFKEQGITCKVPRVLLIVGPNGSGKTLALSEIHRLLRYGNHQTNTPEIVSDLSLKAPQNRVELSTLIASILFRTVANDPNNNWVLACSDSGDITEVPINLAHFDNRSPDDAIRDINLRQHLMDAFCVFPRLHSITYCLQNKKMQIMNADVRPENIHQYFLKHPNRKEKVNKLLKSTFNKTICIEPINNGELRLVIGTGEPPETSIAINPSRQMEQYYRQCKSFERFGDGFRVFVGLITLVFASDHKILLLDEPEIYLHAPLIRRLARELVNEFTDRDGTVLAATHSSDFIAGCLDVTDDIAIVRLTYSQESNAATVSIIEHSLLKRFIDHPVLRNIDALPGLFYESVVIVEGQGDKVAYSEVNRKLNRHSKGIRDTLFISAMGKTNLHSISEPFIKSGIPTATICDFDVFLRKVSINNLKAITALQSASSTQSLSTEIDSCVAILQNYPTDQIKQNGLMVLNATDASRVRVLLSKLWTFGVFVVPFGELESWFSMMGVGTGVTDKAELLEHGLLHIADDSVGVPHSLSDAYSSIWAFVHQIKSWIESRL